MPILRRRLNLLFPLSLALHGLCCWQCCQGQVARYQPTTPTVSPYLNLNAFNTGAVPNYYALVRPQIQQRQQNLQSQALTRSQQSEILRLQNNLQRNATSAGATGTGSWFMQSGTRANYLNSRHFYPQPNIRGRR